MRTENRKFGTHHDALWSTTAVVAPLLVLLLAAGCAKHGRGGTIPLGDWRGTGKVICELWNPENEPQSIHRDYPTTLSLRPGLLDGRPVIEMEIRSKRGELPDLGEETHLIAAFTEAKRVSRDTVLYRLVGMVFEENPRNALRFEEDAPPFGATCTTQGGVTLLQVPYTDNFVDTLRFEGDRVQKSGVYFDQEEGMIHWVENLRRR